MGKDRSPRASRGVRVFILLTQPELRITAITFQKVVVSALFNDLALFKHNNAIRFRNR